MDTSTTPKNIVEPIVLHQGEGENYLLGPRRAPVVIKVSPETGSRHMSAIMEIVGPGDAIPEHIHDDADELIFVHSGAGVEILGVHEYRIEEGTLVFVSQGTWHGLRNASPDRDLVMLAVFSPTGFEGFFRAFGTEPNQEWVEPSTNEITEMRRKYKYRFR